MKAYVNKRYGFWTCFILLSPRPCLFRNGVTRVFDSMSIWSMSKNNPETKGTLIFEDVLSFTPLHYGVVLVVPRPGYNWKVFSSTIRFFLNLLLHIYFYKKLFIRVQRVIIFVFLITILHINNPSRKWTYIVYCWLCNKSSLLPFFIVLNILYILSLLFLCCLPKIFL